MSHMRHCMFGLLYNKHWYHTVTLWYLSHWCDVKSCLLCRMCFYCVVSSVSVCEWKRMNEQWTVCQVNCRIVELWFYTLKCKKKMPNSPSKTVSFKNCQLQWWWWYWLGMWRSSNSNSIMLDLFQQIRNSADVLSTLLSNANSWKISGSATDCIQTAREHRHTFFLKFSPSHKLQLLNLQHNFCSGMC